MALGRKPLKAYSRSVLSRPLRANALKPVVPVQEARRWLAASARIALLSLVVHWSEAAASYRGVSSGWSVVLSNSDP